MQPRQRLLWREVKVGVIVALAMALLAIGIMAVGGAGGGFWTPKLKYYTVLPNASGLYVGSLVMIDGVEVGTVRAIRFNPEGPGVQIVFQVAKTFQDRVREDSLVSVESLGLLGDRYLNIRSGTPAAKVLPPNSYIRGEISSDYAAVANRLAETLPDLQQIARNLKRITEQLDRGSGFLGALMTDRDFRDDMKSVVHQLSAGQGTLGKLLRDDTLYRELTRTMTQLRSRDSALGVLLHDPEQAASFRTTLERLHRMFERIDRGQGTVGKLMHDENLYQEIHQLTAELRDLVQRMHSSESSLGMLMNDPELYRNLQATIADVQKLIHDIRKDPKKYLSVKIALIAF